MNKRDWKTVGDVIRNAAPTRVVLSKTDDEKKMQTHQVKSLSGEILEDVEYFQPYGFTSRPPLKSEAIAFPVGGDRGHLIILAASDRAVRKKEMEEGEVGIYHQNGDYIYLQEGNKLETKTKEATTNAEDKAVTNTKEFEANASETAKMAAGQVASVTGGQQAKVTAPQVGIAGNLTVTDEDGGAGTTTFQGNVIIIGNLNVQGDITVTGDVVAGGVSLRNHIHINVMPGGGTSGPPAGGDA
jgi:phage baseplate assembly protein V